jgi:predicted nucleotide-binding protein (sugar kinase/HSP70/actin superfamily)
MTATKTTGPAAKKGDRLAGRKIWIPRMDYAGARMMAATFRSIGLDAEETPESDGQTLELGGLHTSGEECYPEKVTIGDFLRIIQAPDFDPDRNAFFMPTAEGPCRFGQYGPYLEQVLRELGHDDVPVISPSSKNSYDEFTQHSADFMRRGWWSLIAADIVRKFLLKTRPYEDTPGDTDETFEKALGHLDEVVSRQDLSGGKRFKAIVQAITEVRDMFRAVPATYEKGRPLIGVVGEIFCRLNTFSNRQATRQIEAHGGEAWLSDVGEWIWYTNWSQKALLRRDGKAFSPAMLGALVKNWVQHHDEQKLLEPVREDFVGYEEPEDVYEQVLKPGWPYLPADGALGEMALSIGKACYLHAMGADGVIDISPFSCMNGIVSEAVYHSLSRDYDQMPIRNFYFDASSSNMERDLDIFMELAATYGRKKTRQRRYPFYFEK